MKILAVVNQKGGCGKTTIAVNLAACLAAKNERVLLIDMDPQGHASMGLGVIGDEAERTMYNVLTNEEDDVAPLSHVVLEVDRNLWLAPSNIMLSAIEQQLAWKKGREERLRNCLAEVIPMYDYCMIDCPPSLGMLTVNVLRATEAVLVPIDMSRFSLHGIDRLQETVGVICSRSGHSVQTRVVLNMFDPRTKLAKQVCEMLRGSFGDAV
ncbi:MAG: AAA family ATPase, partial [Chloroflexota bacterium]